MFVPNWMEHAEPGGVYWTTRKPLSNAKSASSRHPKLPKKRLARSTSDTGITTTSSVRSTVAAVGTPVAGCCSVLTGVLLMVFSFARDFRGELLQGLPKHPVERRKGMDDMGERLQERAQLDREHELADDLAGARCDQRRADQHPALTVGD